VPICACGEGESWAQSPDNFNRHTCSSVLLGLRNPLLRFSAGMPKEQPNAKWKSYSSVAFVRHRRLGIQMAGAWTGWQTKTSATSDRLRRAVYRPIVSHACGGGAAPGDQSRGSPVMQPTDHKSLNWWTTIARANSPPTIYGRPIPPRTIATLRVQLVHFSKAARFSLVEEYFPSLVCSGR
jgi:hypothetical protein